MNAPQKLGIVDRSNEPWEDGTGGYFRVVEDGGKFKMYYGAFLRIRTRALLRRERRRPALDQAASGARRDRRPHGQQRPYGR